MLHNHVLGFEMLIGCKHRYRHVTAKELQGGSSIHSMGRGEKGRRGRGTAEMEGAVAGPGMRGKEKRTGVEG